MELIEIIKRRHSVRKYTDRQISRINMEKILEAGAYAPNAGGGQRSMLVGIRNRELTTKIGIMNMSVRVLSALMFPMNSQASLTTLP